MSLVPPLAVFDGENLGHGDHVVLSEVHLTFHPGERIALLGASGAGKSTLLSALRQRLGKQAAWCPQHHGLVPELAVYHNIYMGRLEQHSGLANLWNLLRPLAAPWQDIATLCQLLGLEGLMKRPVGQLSGGQRQRVAIGRALYQQRSVFLGDEPVASVDPHQAVELLQVIHERHQGCVIALHQHRLALTHFDRVWGLDKGRVVLDAPSTELSLDTLDALYPSAGAATKTTMDIEQTAPWPQDSLPCPRGQA
uniref:ATP-binding cassette domain-containing protein n=1 Tax=Halomonas sp. TaxID=1486246 RepID=UPI002627A0BC|nr:ATP-binding cassette domain-containing protein [Halomonas sp.]